MTARPPRLNSLRARLLIGIGLPLVFFIAIVLAGLNALDSLRMQGGQWTLGLGLTVVAGAILIIAWRVSESVTRPLDRLRRAAQQLLTGSFTMELPEGPNEIAQLIVDFNQMALSL